MVADEGGKYIYDRRVPVRAMGRIDSAVEIVVLMDVGSYPRGEIIWVNDDHLSSVFSTCQVCETFPGEVVCDYCGLTETQIAEIRSLLRQ